MARTRTPRPRWLLLAAAFVALVAGLVATRCKGPSSVPPLEHAAVQGADTTPEQPAPKPALRITAVEGSVEVTRSKGEKEIVIEGTLIEEDDALSTLGGRAQLAGPGDTPLYAIELEPGTAIEFGDIDETSALLRLGLGFVRANVRPGSGAKLAIQAQGSDAVAISHGGIFTMTNNGAGVVAVASTEGDTELSSAGKVVILRQGQRSMVRGGAPELPTPVPSSVFLKVDWPAERLRTRTVVVRGKTDPGAIVMVGDQAMVVDSDGNFSGAIKLREGKNVVKTRTLDVMRNRSERSHELTVDTKGPKLEISTEQLWGPKKD